MHNFINNPKQIEILMNRSSHTHLTETPSFAWYVAAALKPLP